MCKLGNDGREEMTKFPFRRKERDMVFQHGNEGRWIKDGKHEKKKKLGRKARKKRKGMEERMMEHEMRIATK